MGKKQLGEPHIDNCDIYIDCIMRFHCFIMLVVGILSACHSDIEIYKNDLMPKEMEFIGIPETFDKNHYMEQKIARIPENKSTFIFITDTHLFLDNSSTIRNARNSSSLMYYIKNQRGVNVGIFGGDCFDYNNTSDLASSNLSDYVNEFFQYLERMAYGHKEITITIAMPFHMVLLKRLL